MSVLNALEQGFLRAGRTPTLAFASAAKLPVRLGAGADRRRDERHSIEIVASPGNLFARTGGKSFYDNLDTVYPPLVDAGDQGEGPRSAAARTTSTASPGSPETSSSR